MRKDRRWLTILVTSSLFVLIGIGLSEGQADNPERLTADEVLELWKPRLAGVEDYQSFGSAPKQSPGLAAYTFRVVGPSFEVLWNHYADLCGIKDRYEARRFLNAGGTAAKGTYIVGDRPSSDSKTRGLSVFLLRTDRYSVTATIQPDRDGKSTLGSLTAVIR
jgi:hypothetical protein